VHEADPTVTQVVRAERRDRRRLARFRDRRPQRVGPGVGKEPRLGIAGDELGVSPDAVYKSGLAPLREAGQIRARTAAMTGGWYWRLADDD
jgi:hypothetical protein